MALYIDMMMTYKRANVQMVILPVENTAYFGIMSLPTHNVCVSYVQAA